jgi:catechol 2,3-dioxygenase-like lactoylglutathione lyase family enzyme
MQTPALNHVALHVTDLRRSQEFYEDVLQLKRIERPNFRFAGQWYI